MTTVTNAFPDHLPADCPVAGTAPVFPAGKDAATFLRELFPFGMVYETLERAFARHGVPAETASLPEKAQFAPTAGLPRWPSTLTSGSKPCWKTGLPALICPIKKGDTRF